MYPPFFVSNVIPMYLISTKKQVITYNGLAGWANILYPDRIRFCESLSPFFRDLVKTGFAEMAYADFL